MLQIISIYFGICILGIGEILFAQIVLDKKIKINKLKMFLIFVLVTILCTITYVCFEGMFKTLLIYIFHLFEFKILFNLDYPKSIFLTFIYIILLIIPDLLQLFIVTNVVGINKIICYNEVAGSVISNLIVCIFFVVITYCLRKVLRKLLNTSISNNTKIIILSLSTFLCVGMIFYNIIKIYKFSNNVILYLIAMMVLVAILFSLIRQTIENNRLMEEYDKLLEFMTTYENEIEKQRILRHETKNEFLAIKAKICDKQKSKEIIEYIDEILKEKITVNQEKYAKFGYLPPNGIKGLCYFKVQEAEKLGIDVSINISSKIKKSSIYNLSVKNQRELGKLLGVFLDNAIEASINSLKKQLGIETYVSKNKEFTMIISNTFNNNINKSKIGKERFTTKGKDRGHGLLLVKHIVDRNDIFEIKTDIINDIYVQSLIIKKINN